MGFKTTNRFRWLDYFLLAPITASFVPYLVRNNGTIIFIPLTVLMVILTLVILYSQVSNVTTLHVDYEKVTFGFVMHHKIDIKKVTKVEKAGKNMKTYIIYYDHNQRQKKRYILDIYKVTPEDIANEITKRLRPNSLDYLDL